VLCLEQAWGWWDVVFCSGDDCLFICGPDGAKIVDLSTGRVRNLPDKKPRSSESESYYQAACSPEGDKVVCGTYSGQISIWHAPSGKKVLQVEHPLIRGGKVEAVTFDNSGRFFATGDYDGRIHIWDVRTGDHIKVLEERMNCNGARVSKVKGLDKKNLRFFWERGAILDKSQLAIIKTTPDK
jgi:WD40 repeat protein